MPKIESVLHFLKASQWERVLINEKGIVANYQDNYRNKIVCA
jgi:hypothetical protein